MKKLFSILSIAALSFAAITSCTKEEQAPVEEEGINITIIGGDKDLNNDPSKTKTYVSEEGNTVHVYWQETDKLRVYEVLDNGEQVYYAATKKTTVLDGGKTAEFEANLSGSVTGEHSSYVYTAIYPEGCVSKSGEKYRVLIPETQTLNNGTNLASDADVLIGAPIDKGNTRISSGDVLEYHFTRYGTTVKMTLRGITAGEKLRKVEIKAPVSISGYSYVNLLTGEITGRGGTNTTITLVIDDVEVNADGSIPVWFRVLSGTWHAINSNPIIIKAYTNDASYSKTIQSTTQDLVFAEGGLTTFGVGLGNRIPNPTIDDGEYVIATKYNDNYYALSSIANGSRLARVDITEGFSAEKYTGTNYDIVWNLTTTSSGTAITTLNGEYLTYASSGASIGTTASYFQIAEVTADSQKYYNISTGSYYLEHNANQGWYAFYASVSATMINNLYLIPADVDKTPKIILDQSSVTLPCNTDSYDITFTKRFLTGEVTAEIDSDENNIISNLSVDGNKVVVTLVPNTEALNKTATINICSEADDIAKPFTLTLEEYVATTTDVITAAILPATGSSYVDLKVSKSTTPSNIQSTAVYEGQTAKSGDNIQMNSNSGRGIWTTASGGFVSTVSVTYGNANNNNINVYGKNSAFSSNSTDGAELIGTLNASTLSVTAKNDYEFILLKPNGATYPASLSITWKPKATVTEIAVKTAPTTTEYHVGDKFDPAGLVITATYDNGSTKDIAYAGNESKFTFSPALDAELLTSNTSVEITYAGKSTTQEITVREWTCQSISITTPPSTMSYYVGDTFNPSGMVLSATYNDGVTDDVRGNITSGYTITPANKVFTEAEISTGASVTVTYDGKSTTLSGITVNALPSLTFNVTSTTNPIEIEAGEYDDTPIAIEASDGVAWTVTLSEGDSDAIVFDESGTGSVSNYGVMIDANAGAARTFVLHFETTAEVLQKTYDVTINQAGKEVTTINVTPKTGLVINAEYDVREMFESNSDGAYTFSIKNSPAGASLAADGYTFTATVAGTYTIVANQAATATHLAASAEGMIMVVAAGNTYEWSFPTSGTVANSTGFKDKESTTGTLLQAYTSKDAVNGGSWTCNAKGAYFNLASNGYLGIKVPITSSTTNFTLNAALFGWASGKYAEKNISKVVYYTTKNTSQVEVTPSGSPKTTTSGPYTLELDKTFSSGYQPTSDNEQYLYIRIYMAAGNVGFESLSITVN